MKALMEVLVISLLVALALFCLYVTFIFVPVVFYTEAECLRNGYPEARVSIGLSRYCMNLDGTVTVRVDKAGSTK